MSSLKLCQMMHRVGTSIQLVPFVAGVLLVVSTSTGLATQKPADVPIAPLVEQQERAATGALFEKVRELIGNGDLRDAAEEIDRVVASADARKQSADIHRSRRMVGLAFAKINNGRDAWDEQKKLLDFELADLSDTLSLNQVPTTLIGMLQLSVPIDRQSATQDACNRAESLVAAMAGDGPVGVARDVLSQIRFIKARIMIQLGEPDKGMEILESERTQLSALVAANEGNRLPLGLYLRALAQLTAQTMDFAKRDALLAEQQEIMAKEIKSMPDNLELYKQFLAMVAARIQIQLSQDKSGDKGVLVKNPEAAMELVTIGRAAFDELFAANPSAEQAMQPFRAQFDQLASVVENQVKLPKLVGTKAVPLTATAWINGDGVSEADREGKVVLLDFWSAWIAPTPGVFAFNNSLQDKYGKQGLQVIGVTRHFNIRWNFTDKVPQRSEQPVPAEEENDALELFLEKHKVTWPTMIAGDLAQLQENYAVSVLPHSVLIDRKGNIRMIKVGFNSTIGAEIELTIKELLAESK